MVKKKLRVIQPSTMSLAVVFYSVQWIDSLHWIFWVLFISRINFDKFKFSLSESKYWFLWIIRNSIMLFVFVVVCLFTADKKVFKKELLRGVKSFKGEWKKRHVSMCAQSSPYHWKLFVNIIFKTISSCCIYTYTIYLIILFSF